MAKQAPNLTVNQITISQLRRTQADIQTWKTAVQSAESIINPNRKNLIELYNNVMADAMLKALYDKRLRAATASPLRYYTEQGIDWEATKIVAGLWFIELCKEILASKFWGYTLVEFDFARLPQSPFTAIPRQNVVPERKMIVRNPSDSTGIPIYEPPQADYLLYVEQGLGMLLEAAPLVIYKRGSVADWAQFCEMFGMPIREYKYNPNDPQSRIEAEQAAKAMGAAAYIVTPEGVDLTLHKGVDGSSGNTVYEGLRTAMNEELAVLILGQTMTTMSGSSRAQAEVHQAQQDEVLREDRNFLEAILNEQFLPLAQKHGLPFAQGGWFAVETKEELSVADIVALRAHYNIPAEYIAERFGIQITEADTPAARQASVLQAKKRPFNLRLSDGAPASRKRLIALIEAGDEKALFDYFRSNLIAAINAGFGDNPPEWHGEEGRLYAAWAEQVTRFAVGKYARTLKAETLEKALEEAVRRFAAEKALATAQAQTGRKFAEWNGRAVVPNLRYQATGDERTRQSHRALNGIVRPANDPFWRSHTPPIAWNCRCNVVETNRAATDAPVSAEALRSNFPHSYFDAAIFPENHRTFGYVPARLPEFAADALRAAQVVITRQREYAELPEQWEHKQFNPQTGGFIAVHKATRKKELKENQEILNRVFAKMPQEKWFLLPDIPTEYNKQAPPNERREGFADAMFNEKTIEFKTINSNGKNTIDNALKIAKEQSSRVLLDIQAPIKRGKLENDIYKRISRTNIQEIWVLIGQNLWRFTREEILKGAWEWY